jgi:predicted GIY-YIG superfamily endonuclease
MGCTILMDVALEVTNKHKPWESGQIVVGLSRTKSCKQITIVTDMDNKEDVVNALRDCLCKVTQWTAMVDSIIERMAVSARTVPTESMCMDMMEHYPFRTCDYALPQSFTGYVYMLMSLACHDEIYIGQTGRNIPVRLSEHNSGKGSYGTESAALMPWGVAAYIDKLSHMNQSERMVLERKWQYLNKLSKLEGHCDVHDILRNGNQVVNEYNAQQTEPEKRISFHKCVELHSS